MLIPKELPMQQMISTCFKLEPGVMDLWLLLKGQNICKIIGENSVEGQGIWGAWKERSLRLWNCITNSKIRKSHENSTFIFMVLFMDSYWVWTSYNIPHLLVFCFFSLLMCFHHPPLLHLICACLIPKSPLLLSFC